jgi:ankyrin repeat protein
MQETVDVNVRDRDGRTPLMIACRYASEDAIEVLLAQKTIDVTAVNKFGLNAKDVSRSTKFEG